MELFRVTVDVPPLNVPLLFQSPDTVCVKPEPPSIATPPPILRSPPITQFEDGVIPDAWVLVRLTMVKDGDPPAIVIGPDPPRFTVPVLVKVVPRSMSVTAEVGLNESVPLLVTLPLFVNEPEKT